MAKETIAVGTIANDGTGDPLRDAMIKVNANFTELYDKDVVLETAIDTPYGGYGMAANATATTITSSGTYYKVAGTTTANTLYLFTHTDNRLTYTGTPTHFFRIMASPISMISAGTNVVVSLKFAKNGTVIGYPSTRKINTGSDVGSASCHFGVSLATNDYIELFITNETNTSTVTVEDLFISITHIA